MSKNQTPAPNPIGKVIFLVFVALLVVSASLYLLKKPGDKAAPTAESSPTNNTTAEPVELDLEAGAVAKAAFEKLLGRWLREDGGYVISISEVMPDGTLKAAYFNPRPIHVSKAAAVDDGGNVKIGIELKDTGYPGCLYTLVFNRELDQLQGTYFQAAQGQTYEVAFIRLSEE